MDMVLDLHYNPKVKLSCSLICSNCKLTRKHYNLQGALSSYSLIKRPGLTVGNPALPLHARAHLKFLLYNTNFPIETNLITSRHPRTRSRAFIIRSSCEATTAFYKVAVKASVLHFSPARIGHLRTCLFLLPRVIKISSKLKLSHPSEIPAFFFLFSF